jgi:hypothetical protein
MDVSLPSPPLYSEVSTSKTRLGLLHVHYVLASPHPPKSKIAVRQGHVSPPAFSRPTRFRIKLKIKDSQDSWSLRLLWPLFSKVQNPSSCTGISLFPPACLKGFKNENRKGNNHVHWIFSGYYFPKSQKKTVQRGYVSPLAFSRLRRPKLKIEVLTFNVLCVLLAEIFEIFETHVQKAYRSVCLFEKIQILSLCILLPLFVSERNSRSLHSKALCLSPLSVRLKSQKYEYPTSLITSGLSNLTLLIFRTQRKTLLWRCVSVQKATPPSLWSLPRFPLSQ